MQVPRTVLKLAVSTVIAVLSLAPQTQAQDGATKPQAPSTIRRGERIGLVLAGGGALGMAHVGVLKVLEENRVPVAFVAGTSMGSIVGAAFATGQTVPEMERVLKESNWDEIFSDSVARQELPYRTKSGRNREIYGDTKLSVEDGKLLTPFGVVQGQRLLPVLQRLYSNAPPSPADFNTFAIPLRVVAADIETGEAVVVSKGDLPTAVRASMSVPGVFAPVEMNGRLLVDGGVVNNLPMDVVRGMGADRLIVVELNAELKKKEELENPLATAGQIISLLLAQNSALQKKTLTRKDILIEPNLKGYSAVDFGKATELIALGEQAAQKVVPELRKLSVSEQEYAAYKQEREITRRQPVIEFVTVKTDKRGAEESLVKMAKIPEGEPLDRKLLDEKVEEIYNTGDYVSVRYDVVEKDGKTGVEIDAKRKEWLDDYFRFGASLQDDFQGETNYNLGGAYRVNDLTSAGGWAQGEVVIGFSPKVSGEFYQPIYEGSDYFVSPRFDLSRQTIYPMVNNEIVAQYQRQQALVGFGFGRQLGHIGEILAEYRAADANIERHIGDPDLPEDNYQIGEAAISLNIDSVDNPDFPTTGTVVRASYFNSSEHLGASDDFNRASLSASQPFTRGRDTLLIGGDFGRTFGGDAPVYRSVAWGGFFNYSGFTQNSILASDWGIARLNYYRRFDEVGSALLGLGFFAGGTLEYGTFTNPTSEVESLTGVFAGSLFLGVDTPILPIYIGGGAAEEGERSMYFAVGRLAGR
ncbi:MAG: patatin [Pseudomonadota bacterium]